MMENDGLDVVHYVRPREWNEAVVAGFAHGVNVPDGTLAKFVLSPSSAPCPEIHPTRSSPTLYGHPVGRRE